MTDEEYLKKRLDRLNQNSHYGIMIDTEITKIVRSHIKRLEENKMKATSVQKIENVREMHFTIEKACTDEISKVIVGAETNDDIFEFHFSGMGCDVFADQWFNEVAEKAYKEDFESERNKRKMMETENAILREKNHKLRKENEKLNDRIGNLVQEDVKLRKEIKDLEKQLNAVTLILDNFRKDHEDILKTQREKHKDEVEQLKQHLKQVEDDKERLTNRYNALSSNYEKEISKVENLKKNYNILNAALTKSQRDYIKWYKRCLKMLSEEDSYKKDHEEPSSRRDILRCAEKCVCGQREQDYGTPESNFQLIADLWNGYLGLCENGDGEPIFSIKSITSMDVSMMMSLMKIARIKNGGGSGDSFVDLAGYAACGGEIWHEQKVKDQN